MSAALIGGCEFSGNGQGLDAQGNPISGQQQGSTSPSGGGSGSVASGSSSGISGSTTTSSGSTGTSSGSTSAPGTTGTGTTGTGGSTTGAANGATFDTLQRTVFNVSCALSGCHSGAGAPLGLQLDAGASYGNLVGVPSVEVPSLKRVSPGDPENSYIIRKLEGTAPVGGRMPLGGVPLSQTTIDGIKQWIAGGAQRAAIAGPLAVTGVSPPDGAALPALPRQIRIFFSNEINATTLDSNSLQLERSGGDGSFGEGNEIPLRPSALRYDAATFTAIVDLDGAPQISDTYRLTVRGSGAAPIVDLGGAALDGNGDGKPGGDFSSTFRVVILSMPPGS